MTSFQGRKEAGFLCGIQRTSCRYWRYLASFNFQYLILLYVFVYYFAGITPGSMPPHSTSLAQEGAAFKSFLLVENGLFKEEDITKALTTPTGAKGATGTRNLADNLSDLKAQVAANQKGIQLVSELIDSYGLQIVQAYMNYIQQNAEVAVRDMLKEIARKTRKR